MTRERAIVLAGVSFVVGLLIGAFILGRYVVPPKEVVKEVPKEVVKEIPMTLPALAQKIRSGEIDVGEEHGLAPDQRYHKIHTTVLGLECASCHAREFTRREVIFFHQDVSPSAPGPVDRRSCLGCHQAGAASLLYTFGSR